MGRLFGTDGIRGFASKYPIDYDTAVKLGRAMAIYFGESKKTVKILISFDTRYSGNMLADAIAYGVSSMGSDVVFAGILTTPALAILTARGNFSGGVSISASHNKFYDNGFKIFDKNGYKLSNIAELELEDMILNHTLEKKRMIISNKGQILVNKNLVREYINFIMGNCCFDSSAREIKIVLDCSNGATSECAPIIFNNLGFFIDSIFCSPNGININDKCGSEYPDILAKTVLNKEADIGLAFDGDGDRLVAVSELGTILTGDQLLAIFAGDLKNKDLLENDIVVSTVMSNYGLSVALEKMDVKHIKTEIGDKWVVKKMIDKKSSLGGENSGHIIFSDNQMIGDGILTAIRLVDVLNRSKKSLSELSNLMNRFPQFLINVNVNSKPDLSKINVIQEAILKIEKKIGKEGRVLVRYSGTQNKCRIMVEGKDLEKTQKFCDYIARIVQKHIGS